MENRNDKKQYRKEEGENTDNRNRPYSPNDDPYIFVPAENIRVIEKVIMNWAEVKKLWNDTQRSATGVDNTGVDCHGRMVTPQDKDYE